MKHVFMFPLVIAGAACGGREVSDASQGGGDSVPVEIAGSNVIRREIPSFSPAPFDAALPGCDGYTDLDFRQRVQDFLGRPLGFLETWHTSSPDVDYTPSNGLGEVNIRFENAPFGIRTVAQNGCTAERIADLPSVTVDVLGTTSFTATATSPAPYPGANRGSIAFTGSIRAKAMTDSTFRVLRVTDGSDVEIVFDLAWLRPGGAPETVWGALSIVTSSGKQVEVSDWNMPPPPLPGSGFPPAHSYE
jgi:hypothetical protein